MPANSLLLQFQGTDGEHRLVEALKAQSLVQERALAVELARVLKLEAVRPGQVLIQQGSRGRDLYLILSGNFGIRIDGRLVSQVGPHQYLGEIGLLDPMGRRSAEVVALEDSIVARVSSADFFALADQHPRLWRTIATGLAQRLLKQSPPRNDHTRESVADDVPHTRARQFS